MSARERTGAAATAEFLAAVTAGDQVRVRSFLDHEPGLANAVDEQGLSPLIIATYHRRPAVVDLLLGRGAPDDLFAASARGDLLAVDVLLDAEPDAVNQYSIDGWTPLALAAHFGSDEIVRHLLASGAEINAVSRNGLKNTPLHAAVAGNQSESADLLLRHGADVNAVDANRWTPLNLAAHAGHMDLVRRLLAAGADSAIPNQGGQTPLASARQQGHQEIAALLSAPR